MKISAAAKFFANPKRDKERLPNPPISGKHMVLVAFAALAICAGAASLIDAPPQSAPHLKR